MLSALPVHSGPTCWFSRSLGARNTSLSSALIFLDSSFYFWDIFSFYLSRTMVLSKFSLYFLMNWFSFKTYIRTSSLKGRYKFNCTKSETHQHDENIELGITGHWSHKGLVWPHICWLNLENLITFSECDQLFMEQGFTNPSCFYVSHESRRRGLVLYFPESPSHCGSWFLYDSDKYL